MKPMDGWSRQFWRFGIAYQQCINLWQDYHWAVEQTFTGVFYRHTAFGLTRRRTFFPAADGEWKFDKWLDPGTTVWRWLQPFHALLLAFDAWMISPIGQKERTR